MITNVNMKWREQKYCVKLNLQTIKRYWGLVNDELRTIIILILLYLEIYLFCSLVLHSSTKLYTPFLAPLITDTPPNFEDFSVSS